MTAGGKKTGPLQSATAGGFQACFRWTLGRIDLMDLHGLSISPHAIAELCNRHRIRRLSLFGSILDERFGPASDVDVLIEFEPGAKTGFEFFSIEDELTQIIGRQVDLNTYGSLSKYFRDDLQPVTIYDASRSNPAPAYA